LLGHGNGIGVHSIRLGTLDVESGRCCWDENGLVRVTQTQRLLKDRLSIGINQQIVSDHCGEPRAVWHVITFHFTSFLNSLFLKNQKNYFLTQAWKLKSVLSVTFNFFIDYLKLGKVLSIFTVIRCTSQRFDFLNKSG
jgi:hypothetical protein